MLEYLECFALSNDCTAMRINEGQRVLGEMKDLFFDEKEAKHVITHFNLFFFQSVHVYSNN